MYACVPRALFVQNLCMSYLPSTMSYAALRISSTRSITNESARISARSTVTLDSASIVVVMAQPPTLVVGADPPGVYAGAGTGGFGGIVASTYRYGRFLNASMRSSASPDAPQI